MERMEFRQRVKGLVVWMLVMMLVVNNVQGGKFLVHAEDVTGSSEVAQIEVPITYYDIYSPDDPSKSVLISQTANENGAIITSTEYSESIILSEYESTLRKATVQFPSVEKKGFVLERWELYGCEYIEADMPEDSYWDLGVLVGEVEKPEFAFVAVWVDAPSVYVTFDKNNLDEETISDDYAYVKTMDGELAYITLPEAPVYEGYKFAGWLGIVNDEEMGIYDANTEVSFSSAVEGVTFIAQWECELPITYDTADGTIISDNYDTSVTVSMDATGAEGVILPTVEKDGYFFVNWKLEISGGGTYDAGARDITWDSTMPAADLTEIPFTAKWQEALVSVITYDYAGGMMNGYADSYVAFVVQPEIDSMDFEEPIIDYKPTKEGYIFTDWELQTSETGRGSYEGGKISGNYGENYTLVAKFRPENTISITATMADGFEDAGTIEPGMAKTYGESTQSDGNGNALLNLPEVKEITNGYLFAGWKCFDETGKEVIADGYIDITDYDDTVISCYPAGTSLCIAYPTDDNNAGGNSASYTLEAQFKKAAKINLNFDLNGGTGDIATKDIVYQSTIGEATVRVTMPNAPEREKYEFLGWYYDGEQYAPGANVDVSLTKGDVTFSADWKQIVEAGKALLQVGQAYKLAEGNWTVNGDTTVYVGGSDFYVSEEAEYTFTQK